MTRRKRVLLIAVGIASVGIGIVGALLPILPTTPFLLLATYLFARSSERLHRWLLGNRLVGDYLRRYYEGRCMSRRHKAGTLVMLWLALATTALFIADSWLVRGVLGVVGVAVTIHILTLQGERAQRE